MKMADEISLKVIKKTQDLLGAVIKKPPLHDKLLKKPPFRFLHDIIHNVIKATKFLDGLYTAEELNSENIKDKEAKLAFLQKAIDVVIMVTGTSLTVRPTKVVAGHEPEKTNEFLQTLAKAAAKKLDCTDAVQRVLAGEKPSVPAKGEKKSEDKKKERIGKAIERSSSQDSKHTGQRSNVKDKGRPTDKTTTRPKGSKSSEQNKSKRSAGSNNAPPAAPAEIKILQDIQEVEEATVNKENVTDSSEEPKEEVLNGDIAHNEEIPIINIVNGSQAADLLNEESAEIVQQMEPPPDPAPSRVASSRPPQSRPPTSINTELHGTHILNKDSGLETPTLTEDPEMLSRPPTRARSTLRSSRPRSSRPAAPRIRKREDSAVQSNSRITSAKPVENVILDSDKPEENEEETFVLEEPLVEPISQEIAPSFETLEDDKQQGSLVKQLLETKKELESGSQHQATIIKPEVEKPVQHASRDHGTVEHLRTHIQAVSRSALPLGRLLDLLSEDLDAMTAELKSWKEEHQKNMKAYGNEQSLTESVLEPLKQQLEELEQATLDQLELISATKSNIYNNNEKLQRILAAAHLGH